jgi:uncharacterized surface protein with fasciclin (FAS1) repeats
MDQSKSARVGEAFIHNPAAPAKDIVGTTMAAGNFTAFAACVKTAGLTDTLAAKGPFTVFAPTDAAFEKLPAGAYAALLKDSAKLKAVLSYHIVPGYFMSKDMKSGEVMTLQGSTLTITVSSTDVRVNGAGFNPADILTTNGVVHAIDAVILPKHWQLLASAA